MLTSTINMRIFSPKVRISYEIFSGHYNLFPGTSANSQFCGKSTTLLIKSSVVPIVSSLFKFGVQSGQNLMISNRQILIIICIMFDISKSTTCKFLCQISAIKHGNRHRNLDPPKDEITASTARLKIEQYTSLTPLSKLCESNINR